MCNSYEYSVFFLILPFYRKRKFILLKDGSTKYYDELVLACGEQFQHPEYLKDALNLVKEVKLV